MSSSLSQSELAELYDKTMTVSAGTKQPNYEVEPDRLKELRDQYPDYVHWIMTTALAVEAGEPTTAPATNENCPNPFESKPVVRMHRLKGAGDKPFDYKMIPPEHLDNPGLHIPRAKVALNKGTQDQVLKIMLTRGTPAQVFQAAKKIGMIPQATPESDENFAKVKTVVDTLSEVIGLYSQGGAPEDPLQALKHAREFMRHGQGAGDPSCLIGSVIDGQEVTEEEVGRGIYFLNKELDVAIAAFLAEADTKLAADPTRNGLIALYTNHFAQVYKDNPKLPRYILETIRSRIAAKVPAWVMMEMGEWEVGLISDTWMSPFARTGEEQ